MRRRMQPPASDDGFSSPAPPDSVLRARQRTSPVSCRCRLPGRPLISAHPRYPATPMFSRHNIEEVRRPRTADGRICGKCGRTSRLFRQATTHISDIMPRVRGSGRLSEKCAVPGATQPVPLAGYRGCALSRGRPNRCPWQDVREVCCPGGDPTGAPGRIPGMCVDPGVSRPAAATSCREETFFSTSGAKQNERPCKPFV